MNIVLFTNAFPFGNAEYSFLDPELKELARHADQVLLISLGSGEQHHLPNNVELVTWRSYLGDYSKLEVLKLMSYAGLKQWLKPVYLFSHAKNLVRTAAAIAKALGQRIDSNTLFYSYWWEDPNTLAALVRNQLNGGALVSRAHRFDLYDEFHPEGSVPFRRFHLQQTERVFPISAHGKAYLDDNYYISSAVSRLGVRVDNEFLANEGTAYLELISCSRAEPVKRLDLIVEMLSHAKQPVRWTHLGDGSKLAEIKQLAASLPNHVKCVFKGALTNSEVLNFYANNPADVFINLSDSEGIPVSIMEAMKYGIPAVARNVGGNAELVGSGHGLLLDDEVNTQRFMKVISGALIQFRNTEYRNAVRSFVAKNFDMQENYRNFGLQLKQVNEIHQS